MISPRSLRRVLLAVGVAAALVVGAATPSGAVVDRLADQRPAWTLTILQAPTTRMPNQNATLVVRVADRPGDNLKLKHLAINGPATDLLGGTCATAFPNVLPDGASSTFSCTVPPQPNGTYWPINIVVNVDVVRAPLSIQLYHDFATAWKWIRWTWNV